MKKTLIIIILAALLLIGSNGLMAKNRTGSAVIPHFTMRNSTSTNHLIPWFYISNLTDATVTVTVTFYDKDGLILQDGDDSGSTGLIRSKNITGAYDDNPTDASVTFEISAHKTIQLYLNSTDPDSDFGYGMIEWEQNSKATVALVAVGKVTQYLYSSNYAYISSQDILINNSLPF